VKRVGKNPRKPDIGKNQFRLFVLKEKKRGTDE